MTFRTTLLESLGRISRGLPHFRGRARLQRAVHGGFRRLGRVERLSIVVDGVVWSLDLDELIQFRLFWDGAHDGHVLGWLAQEARLMASPVLWDVGANIGALALPFARQVPEARVEAFEPSPRAFGLLELNRRANPGLRVRSHPMGLADRDGVMPFHESAEAGNGGLGSFALAANVKPESVEVGIARGDRLVSEGAVEAPRLIKVDVEGFEPEVLAGLRDTIAAHRPLLCVESASYRLAGRGLPEDAVVEALRALGYRVSVIDADGERALRAGDLRTNCDLAGRPA
jgi:FkbM family methyltransferase